MRKLFFLAALVLTACTCTKAQVINNGPLTVDNTNSTYASTGSSCFITPVVTVSGAVNDTFKLKIYGGTAQNTIHFWHALTKSGATANDGVIMQIYGTAETGTGTNFQLLYTDTTVSFTGTKVYNHVIPNVYTNYWGIVVGKAAKAVIATGTAYIK